ncbi:hypothetical protein GTA26_29110 [Rhodococcus hoagii]|nr:hypothetical protein [Prescottella equi]
MFEVIVNAYDQAQLTTMGLHAPFAENLRHEVTALAQDNRTALPELLGITTRRRWQMPTRLADGRVGYLLSGRGGRRPNPYLRRLRLLYPTYTDAQLDAWLNDARWAEGGIEARLQRCEDQYRSSIRICARGPGKAPVMPSDNAAGRWGEPCATAGSMSLIRACTATA